MALELKKRVSKRNSKKFNEGKEFMPFLVNIESENEAFELQDMHVVGSDSSCQTQLRSEHVDERHFRIERREQAYFLRDLRSSTGTFVNGLRAAEIELKEDDQIQIGDSKFMFQTERPDDKTFSLTSLNDNWSLQLKRLGPAARTDFPILLLGPSGSGKDVLAQAICKASHRSRRPFYTVNCSALTETLIESELFGHVKGSFTGATSDRKGAFQAAHKGTLFLDEIGDLPLHLQSKLLRALENNEIRPVGSDQCITVDVRVIAATHQNLAEKVRLKQFRADLFYRLNVLQVSTPSLDERKEDFENLLIQFAKQYKVGFSIAAIKKLQRCSWPGNIRELRNTVARAAALFPKQRIEEEHVPCIKESQLSGGLTEDGLPLIRAVEKQMIVNQLKIHRGNQRRAARELGLAKSTFHDRLKDYQINPREFSSTSYVGL